MANFYFKRPLKRTIISLSMIRYTCGRYGDGKYDIVSLPLRQKETVPKRGSESHFPGSSFPQIPLKFLHIPVMQAKGCLIPIPSCKISGTNPIPVVQIIFCMKIRPIRVPISTLNDPRRTYLLTKGLCTFEKFKFFLVFYR